MTSGLLNFGLFKFLFKSRGWYFVGIECDNVPTFAYFLFFCIREHLFVLYTYVVLIFMFMSDAACCALHVEYICCYMN